MITIENIRTSALPFETKPYTFKMTYYYDSFNRMQQMTYPDGEVASYHYGIDTNGDSLGSSSWITFATATPIAPFAHLPISSFANSPHNSLLITYNSSHSFSAKERDVETGLSYFGTRYYSSNLSIWLSVDPISGKYPSLSPYVYCANNPVMRVDPNGEDVCEGGDPSSKRLKRFNDFFDTREKNVDTR